ncbi:hypothetical protein OH76DRAFT_10616 [Lentinus brumalis]|uniref:Uncharacterized protein n=1 Tax=Lentinus brumalis TaxID=2498619 RepID=A0A371DX21_9APHY|nr:hypothetical protein OH76DRAFT_10616 [Polyporus brumalis]
MHVGLFHRGTLSKLLRAHPPLNALSNPIYPGPRFQSPALKHPTAKSTTPDRYAPGYLASPGSPHRSTQRQMPTPVDHSHLSGLAAYSGDAVTECERRPTRVMIVSAHHLERVPQCHCQRRRTEHCEASSRTGFANATLLLRRSLVASPALTCLSRRGFAICSGALAGAP